MTTAQNLVLASPSGGSGYLAPRALVNADIPSALTGKTYNGLTITSTTGTLTVTNGKTASFSNTLTFTGTDGSSAAFGAGGTVAYTGNKLSVFAATSSSELAGVISDETGSGALVFGTSPTFTTSITAPLLIGGSATTGTLQTFQTTTGNGTTDRFAWLGGNNGATTFGVLSSAGLGVSGTTINGIGTSRAISLNAPAAGSGAFEINVSGGATAALLTDGSTYAQFQTNSTVPWFFITNNITRFSIGGTGEVTVRPDVATPAAGSTSARLLFGTTAGFGIYYGSGAPTVSAAQGSIYLRSDGSSTSTRMYVNTTGSTTWTNVTTAA